MDTLTKVSYCHILLDKTDTLAKESYGHILKIIHRKKKTEIL